MENREAIEWLKGSVVSYEVDNKGRPNGNVTCDLTQEVLDMAIAALEKQKPVKVDSEWDRYYGKNNPCCGACGAYVDEYSKYCKRCGRPIDWSD